MSELVTLAQAAEILAGRGMPIDAKWLRAKASSGAIEGAEKVTARLWMVPREWAETYVKDSRGRKRSK